MTRITNTILSTSIPNPQYKKNLNGHLTLIIPSHPSRCVSWNFNRDGHYQVHVLNQDYTITLHVTVSRFVKHQMNSLFTADLSAFFACCLIHISDDKHSKVCLAAIACRICIRINLLLQL
mgnify:FL=1